MLLYHTSRVSSEYGSLLDCRLFAVQAFAWVKPPAKDFFALRENRDILLEQAIKKAPPQKWRRCY